MRKVDDEQQAEPLMSMQEVASLLKMPSVGTLRNWRASGYGPPGFRVGRYVRYRRSDVLAWIVECVRRSA
jgi:predicted DNA-binding transcriptional regulator AlpA